MFRHLKLSLDRKTASIRETLEYMDKNFYMFKSDHNALESIEEFVRSLDTVEKDELLNTIIRIRLRRMISKL